MIYELWKSFRWPACQICIIIGGRENSDSVSTLRNELVLWIDRRKCFSHTWGVLGLWEKSLVGGPLPASKKIRLSICIRFRYRARLISPVDDEWLKLFFICPLCCWPNILFLSTLWIHRDLEFQTEIGRIGRMVQGLLYLGQSDRSSLFLTSSTSLPRRHVISYRLWSFATPQTLREELPASFQSISCLRLTRANF